MAKVGRPKKYASDEERLSARAKAARDRRAKEKIDPTSLVAMLDHRGILYRDEAMNEKTERDRKEQEKKEKK